MVMARFRWMLCSMHRNDDWIYGKSHFAKGNLIFDTSKLNQETEREPFQDYTASFIDEREPLLETTHVVFQSKYRILKERLSSHNHVPAWKILGEYNHCAYHTHCRLYCRSQNMPTKTDLFSYSLISPAILIIPKTKKETERTNDSVW